MKFPTLLVCDIVVNATVIGYPFKVLFGVNFLQRNSTQTSNFSKEIHLR